MPKTKDYYEVLGVPRAATQKDISTAFRKLARKHHPDLNAGDKQAEACFKEVSEAHEVLSDAKKRKLYGGRWLMSGIPGAVGGRRSRCRDGEQWCRTRNNVWHESPDSGPAGTGEAMNCTNLMTTGDQ
jgi:DnaJ-class molecular chaperone